MWSGVVPFLVHWLALSSHLYSNQWRTKTHWNLLSDFQQLPEDEIEEFLPQICNILVERDHGAPDEFGVYTHFHKLLVEKCAGCLPFGLRVCSLLKSAAQGSPSTGGIFKAVLGSAAPNDATARESRLHYLHQQAEEATSHGLGLPQHAGYLRAKYFTDLNFLLGTMARLGRELKAHPVEQRNQQLRAAVAQLNGLLFSRMMAQGAPAQWSPHYQQGGVNAAGSGGGFYGITSYQVAQACPDAAAYSLHLPLQHCREKVQRILQFVEAECEVLPSKERCPYVLVAELLEQPFTCKSDELFTHRRVSGAVGTGSGSGSVGTPRVDDIVAGVSGGGGGGDSGSSSTLGPGPGPGPGGGGDATNLGHLQIQTAPALAQHPQQQPQQQPQPQPQQQQYSTPPHTYPQNLYQQPQHNSPYFSPQGAMLPHTPAPPAFSTIKSVEDKVASIRASSPFGHLPGWGVKSFIVKSGDDLRKELLAMQVIDICQHVFQLEGLDLSLHPYQIISTGPMAGLVEFVEGTMSLDRMKKSAAHPAATRLKHYFEFAFGHSFSPAHQRAVQNFVRSLAGYSLMTYLLQVRDRHNANLLIDADGHIVHIDYGFILGGAS